MNIVENSLLYAGVDNGFRDISITIGPHSRKSADLFRGRTFKQADEAFGGTPPFSPFTKKIYGLKYLVEKFRLSVLARDWCGFLNGEPLVLPENELVIRSFGEIIPNREMGEYVMNAFLCKDSAYLKFGKLDDSIDVHAEVVEGSTRVSYFRKQKVDPNGKVMMRCKFALRIQLKRALPVQDISYYDSVPWKDFNLDTGFYSKIKAVLDNHEKYFYNRGGNYIIKKAENEGESNGRFALDLAYQGETNFFKFLNYWLVVNQGHPYAKPLEEHRAIFSRRFMYAWSSSPQNAYYSMVSIFSEEKPPRIIDLNNCLAFLQNLTASKVRELSDPFSSGVFRRFYGVSVELHLIKSDLFGDKFIEARDAAVEALKMMIGVYRDTSRFIDDKLAAEWNSFTEGHKILMANGSEIPDLDKCCAMNVAQAVSVDPQMFLEDKGAVGKFANNCMLGEFYNG